IVMLAVPFMLLRLRQHGRDYFIIAVLGVLMLGCFAPWAPYALMQALPVFGSLRVPVRYALLIDLHIGLLFGHMLARTSEVVRELGRPWLRRAATIGLAGLLGAATLDLTTHN